MRIAALVVAGLILIAGTALAASSLLGDPAPPPIQAALDAYYPDTNEPLSPVPQAAGSLELRDAHGATIASVQLTAIPRVP